MRDAPALQIEPSEEISPQKPEHFMRRRPRKVIFVAYGRKEEVLWRKYLPRLARAPGLEQGFDLSCWPDGASFTKGHRLKNWLFPVTRRSEKLLRYLEGPPFVDPDPHMDADITLVGLGKGCRIIQAYLLRCLWQDNTARGIRRLRQVVFVRPSRIKRYRVILGITVLATIITALLQIHHYLYPDTLAVEPSLIGLGTLIALVSLLFGVISNPSAMELLGLRSVQLDRDDLEKQFQRLILEGNKHKPGTWPVACRILDIDDFGDEEESDAIQIAQVIQEPIGHKNVYDVDLLERRIVITPTTGLLPKEVEIDAVDNTTDLVHEVTFSEFNTTSEESAITPWELRYQSYGGKVQVNEIPKTNRWTPQERSAYQRTHGQYVFRFSPTAGQTYTLSATVWNGFSKGRRDSHMHLRADAYFKRVHTLLDLRPYLKAGWQIQRSPEAYFFFGRIPKMRGNDRDLDGPSCDCIKNNRILEEGMPVEVTMKEPGLYSWTIGDIRDGGIIGFLFDVHQAETK